MNAAMKHAISDWWYAHAQHNEVNNDFTTRFSPYELCTAFVAHHTPDGSFHTHCTPEHNHYNSLRLAGAVVPPPDPFFSFRTFSNHRPSNIETEPERVCACMQCLEMGCTLEFYREVLAYLHGHGDLRPLGRDGLKCIYNSASFSACLPSLHVSRLLWWMRVC